MTDDPKTLVSTQWLAQHLKDPDLRILDASWYLPDAGRDPKAEYADAHIPGARFFDILPKWLAEDREVEDMPPIPRDRHMTVRFQNHLVRDVTQVAHASKMGTPQIVDARAATRFRGDAPEPREGLRSGHIPKSRNVPFGDLLNADQTMKTPEETRAIFEGAGVDMGKPIVTSCGSGITAAILALALERMGHSDWALYDGSWAEWGMFPTVPIATGDA